MNVSFEHESDWHYLLVDRPNSAPPVIGGSEFHQWHSSLCGHARISALNKGQAKSITTRAIESNCTSEFVAC